MGSNSLSNRVGYLSLILVAVFITTIATIELAVALNLGPSRLLMGKAIWVGALLWVSVAAVSWKEKFKNSQESLWCEIVITILALGSVAGIYSSMLFLFTLWANAVLSVLFFAVMTRMMVRNFPQAWKSCVAKSVKS